MILSGLSGTRDWCLKTTIVAGGSDLDSAIADYELVYAASWKVPEPYPRFLPGLIRTCARMGWLRLGLLYVEPLSSGS